MGLWNSTLKEPWRPVDWSKRESMLQDLKEFQSNRKVDHVRILVVGPAGAGKSAFINSVNNVLQGRNTCLSHSLSGGLNTTRKYTVYKLNKDNKGSFFPFVFGDTMGLEKDSTGAHTDDIISILQGNMQVGYTFNTSKALSPEGKYYIKTPTVHDKVHCLVFVLPGDNIHQMPEEIITKMKQIQEKAFELGLPQVVIMSMVDKACPLVGKNMQMIYKRVSIRQKMELCCYRLGVPLRQIFPVKNYHEEICNNDEMDMLLLMAMTNIVNFANDFVQVSEEPWRSVPWSETEQTLLYLKEFQPSRSVEHLRILVVGPAGAGKSAFITSVNTALQGCNTYLAYSLTAGTSATLKYTVYKLNKDTEGTFFPFVFGDTMGFESTDSDGLGAGVHTDDIISILQGHMPEGYTFNPSKKLTAENNDYNRTPSLNDKVHCLVFVLPGDNIDQLPEKIVDKIKQIQQKARELGIPQVVIMSKVDVTCSLVKENLKMIYQSKTIRQKMEKCNISLGVQMNCIFPVKNYREEINNNARTDILILIAVKNIVNFASDFVKRNLQNEQRM